MPANVMRKVSCKFSIRTRVCRKIREHVYIVARAIVERCDENLSELGGHLPGCWSFAAAGYSISYTNYSSPTPECSSIRFHVIVILFRTTLSNFKDIYSNYISSHTSSVRMKYCRSTLPSNYDALKQDVTSLLYIATMRE